MFCRISAIVTDSEGMAKMPATISAAHPAFDELCVSSGTTRKDTVGFCRFHLQGMRRHVRRDDRCKETNLFRTLALANGAALQTP
jgi:hypothetical protein